MIAKKITNFDLYQITNSGQCFRMKQINENTYYTIAHGKYIKISRIEPDVFGFSCTQEDFDDIWVDYFDLETDYSFFKSHINQTDIFLINAVNYGWGIRILKQDLWETMVSFIISQRKSIPAISTCIESLCRAYGKVIYADKNTYYDFPTPESLAGISLEELLTHGLGYRAKYILNLSKEIVTGNLCLDDIKKMKAEDSYNKLMSIYGIGTKITNCIQLFGLYEINSFPEDVWIKRIIADEYNGNFNKDYYNGYAGIIQQYMFYYKRYHK